ncbi:MAG: DNA cytosine methyltransferase, partial [Bacilli bacterium]
MKTNKKIRLFEAFAGIGAQSVALKRAGIEVEHVGISEWFIDAIITYDALNTSEERVSVPSYEKQIEELSHFTFSRDSQKPIKSLYSLPKDVLRKLYIANKRSKNYGSISEILPKDMPPCDLLTYSFPCQDLSTGGKTLGMKKGSGTRSGLLWEIERILTGMDKDKLPTYLLLENVPTILAKSNISDLNQWLGVLEKLGYKNSDPTIMDASEFGVPQDRRRCIIVSSLKRKIDLKNNVKKIPLPDSTDFVHEKVEGPVFKEEADAASLNPTKSREKMWEINHRSPVTSNTIFHTVTCNMDRNNNAGMVEYTSFPGRKYRLLTIREATLLMGFTPEEYETIKKLG